nr:hypothetical protein [uncultured Oscillibacter sp.]
MTICTGEKAVTMLLKIEKKPVDYLYQTAVEADGSISWNSGLTFCGVHREALDRFFGGNEPDGQFHSGYALDQLPEAAFIAWLQDPEGFIETGAEQYIKTNQEKFLLQFLRNDALLAEYQALIQDLNNPLHRVKAISEAIKTSGAKTVTVTVQKKGEELSFRTGTTPLRGRYNSYSTSHIAAADQEEFERLFGRHVNYTAGDITRITYGRNTIYEAPPLQAEEMAEGMKMGGMEL